LLLLTTTFSLQLLQNTFVLAVKRKNRANDKLSDLLINGEAEFGEKDDDRVDEKTGQVAIIIIVLAADGQKVDPRRIVDEKFEQAQVLISGKGDGRGGCIHI
jgi:hypothetical protein